jgi:hypothetical protein
VSDHEREDLEGMEDPGPDAAGASPDEERLLRLERSVRQLRIALAAVAVAGAGFALAGLASGRKLTVRELAVEDADGRVRIALSAAKGDPVLEHYDEQGRLRIAEGVDADGKAAWTLLDTSGRRRVGAAAFADGDAAIALLDGNGKVRIQQLAAADGTAATLHLDALGRKRIETIATGNGSAVNSYLDAAGSVRLQIGTSAEGEAVLPAQARGYEPKDDAEEEPAPAVAEAPRSRKPAAR